MATPTNNDDIINIPLGETTVDALGGFDTLVLDWSAVDGPIRTLDYGGWGDGVRRIITDDGLNTVDARNFNVFKLTGGMANDDLWGWNNADSLNGGAGDDRLSGGLGADVIDGGTGAHDTWAVDYSSLSPTPIALVLKGGGLTATVSATGAQIKNVEQVEITTGTGDDNIDTSALVGNDIVSTGVGNDTISSGRGTDSVWTGDGLDTLVMNWSAATKAITFSDLGNWVYQYADKQGDRMTVNEAYRTEQYNLTGGSGNDTLRGLGPDRGAYNDALKGNGGDDTLAGYQGIDIIDGGTGTDLYIGDFTNLSGGVKVDIAATTQVKLLNDGSNGSLGLLTGIERLSINSSNGNDILTANPGVFNDTFTTYGGDDIVTTGRGVDSLWVGDGNDTVIMNWSAATTHIAFTDLGNWNYRFSDGEGDKLSISEAWKLEQFNLTGGSGNDYLRGLGADRGTLNDTLTGNAGNDTLYSGAGNDKVDGGTGTDTWVADISGKAEPVLVNALDSQDPTKPQGGAANLVIRNIEAMDISTGSGDDNLSTDGFSGNDRMWTNAGNDTVNTGRGVDAVMTGDGTDLLVMNWAGATTPVVFSDLGNWVYRYSDGNGDELTIHEAWRTERWQLTGGSGNDSLRGLGSDRGAFDDNLSGGAGNDTLNSGSGNDTVDGGAGTDTWIADQSGESLAIVFNAATSQTTAQGTGAGLSISKIEAVSISTGGGADTISTAGYALNDNVASYGGDDIINLGRGIDTVWTGDGTDLLIMNWGAATTAVTFADLGNWTWRYSDGNGDQLTINEAWRTERWMLIGGSGDDYLHGLASDRGAFSDNLTGGAGNDTLDTGSGNDTVDGGTGNDTWIADQSAKMVAVAFNAATSQTTAQGGVAGLSISKVEILNLSTGSGNDTLNTSGYAFNDTVYTYAGNDSVNLGGGYDVANGGDGTDTLTLSMASATSDISRTDVGGGWYVYADANGTASMQFANFEVFNLTGGGGNDNLYGGGGNDSLVGGVGDDYLVGYGSGGGSAAGSYDVINGGGGSDSYYGNFDGINKTLNLTLNAAGDGNLVDAAAPTTKYVAFTGIESLTLYTGQGGDSINLAAVAGDQNLYTRDGNDMVSLGQGHHYYEGGNGTDTAVIDFSSSTTSITGLAQYGNATLSDAAGLNSVTFNSVEVFNITGGSGNDRLMTYGGGDVLRGGDGNDVLYGGDGNDVLYGGNGNDTFRFGIGGQGLDTIMDAAGGDVIKFDGAGDGTFSSIAAGNGTATANHVIELETKADGYTYLYFGTNGTAGADITLKLLGTYGAAAFQIVNTGRDLKVVLGNSTPGTPGDDNLPGTSGNDFLDGGLGNDSLYGKDGDDTLLGGDGNDLLIGGMGHDSLTGGPGIDTFLYNSTAESPSGAVYSDFIQDFAPGTDKIDLHLIDANPVVGGDQAFAFIGTADFSGSAGELRWIDSTDPATPDLLQADVNGDGIPDMEIQLTGNTTGITAGSFVL